MNDEVRRAMQLQMNQQTARDGQTQINLESETVSLVMRTFGVDRYLSRIRDHHRTRFGTPGLSVEAFNDVADGFPFLLFCSSLKGIKLHDDKNSTLPKMFSAFDLTPLGKAYRTAYDNAKRMYAGDVRTICLIVKRLGVRGGLAVYPSGVNLPEVPGLRLTYTASDDSYLPGLHIEPLPSLLQRVKRVWEPQFAKYEEQE